MKVLFIGGTGVISQAVSPLVVERGMDLYLFNRGKTKAFIPEGAKLIEGTSEIPRRRPRRSRGTSSTWW